MKNPLKPLFNWIREKLLSEKTLHKICIIIQKLKTGVPLVFKGSDAVRILKALNEALLILELTHHHNATFAIKQAITALEPMNKADRGKKFKKLGGLLLSRLEGIDEQASEDRVKKYYDDNKDQIELEVGDNRWGGC